MKFRRFLAKKKKIEKKNPDEFSFVSLTMTMIELALFLFFFSSNLLPTLVLFEHKKEARGGI